MNSFGKILRFSSFGESHGPAIGGTLEGIPAGFKININQLNEFIKYRKPGESSFVSPRKEPDEINFLSGINDDNTTIGSPISFVVFNKDIRTKDYTSLKEVFRPSHADFTYFHKYGVSPLSGGGRSSARETIARCIAGGIVLQWLEKYYSIQIQPFISQIGNVKLTKNEKSKIDLNQTYSYISRIPCQKKDLKAQHLLKQCLESGDSVGGIIECRVKGLPIGLGEPIYDKLSARLAYAMLSINASKGFEIGDGFMLSSSKGSLINDPISINKEGDAYFLSNNMGGVLGGISNGDNLEFKVAFKPTPSISIPQKTITTNNIPTTIKIEGRHDPCLTIRAVPIVQAMTALVIADFILLHKKHL